METLQAPSWVLATRLSRLVAFLIDAFLIMLIATPLVISTGLVPENFEAVPPTNPLFSLLISGCIWMALNGYLLKTYGQTIGKRIVGIKIVHTNGTHIDFVKVLSLRYIVFWVIGAVPGIGAIVSLIDALFIFNDDRRCLHDRLADTIVIRA